MGRSSTLTSFSLRRRVASAAAIGMCAALCTAAAAQTAASGTTPTEPDSVVVCATCATVVSVRSETRVARKGLGSTAGASLDSGVLGDQPDGRGINDTTNSPPGTTSAGLIMPKADRRLTDATVWTVVLQRRDGTTTSVQVPDDPVLRPGDLVTMDGSKLALRKR